ncbi:MAG: site-2 protease family protein [Clostridium sp.]
MDNMFIIEKLIAIPAIMIAMTFHGYAQAFMADRLGDKTPKFEGRLTLNPLAHIDPIGFLMFIVVRFGWSKPVNINRSSFKNYRKDNLKVTIAGPIANLLVALICALILGVYFGIANSQGKLMYIIVSIITQTLLYNVLFAILSLVPLPGFDGFRILTDLFPRQTYSLENKLSRYSMYILLGSILPILPGGYSILSLIVSKPSQVIIGVLNNLITFISSLI